MLVESIFRYMRGPWSRQAGVRGVGLVLLISLLAIKACSGEIIDVGDDLASLSGGWQARVAGAPARSTIRFQPGVYRADGAGGCNVSLPADVQMVAATPGTVIIDCQGVCQSVLLCKRVCV